MDLARAEIMKNRFSAMAEEAATVAYRTAHTTFVKQTQDFQVALARTSGEFFAYPMLTGVTSGGGPMNLIFEARHTSAKFAFSLSSPYPGCTASAPAISAAEITDGIFR